MIERDAARRICDAALAASGADACEVRLGGGIDALTRFANNEIHQNMASESYQLSVRSILGRRTGRASTTRLDDAGIRAVVAESERITRLMPERDDLLPLLGPQENDTLDGAHDAATAALGADARADMARQMIDAARSRGLTAAGIVRVVEGDVGDYGEKNTIALATSNGLFAYHRQTWAKLTTTIMAPDSSGWADAEAHAAGTIDAADVGRIAAEKAVASAQPRSLAPGAYTVILEPAAVAELLAFLMAEFSATVVDEGRSFLSNRTGTQIFGANIRLTSDPYHPLHRTRPFDEEGVPTKRVVLVDGGKHRGLVYDRATAKRLAAEPTGHGLPVPTTEGALASRLVLDGGTTSLADMIASTDRGVLITRVWYTRTVDPVQLVITGMTRDGTFWVEGGRVRHGIKNFRFNQSLIDLLSHVVALGPQVYAWPCVVPPLKVEGFRFTSETSF